MFFIILWNEKQQFTIVLYVGFTCFLFQVTLARPVVRGAQRNLAAGGQLRAGDGAGLSRRSA